MKQKATIFMIIFALFLSVGCMKKKIKRLQCRKEKIWVRTMPKTEIHH